MSAGPSSRPPASSAVILQRMHTTRRRDTGPEVQIRSLLHRAGLRFRVDARAHPSLRGRVDILFRRARVAVFVDGCFWHGCPRHATWPKANADWWRAKLAANQVRDANADAALRALGFSVVRIWEHEDPVRAARRIERLVRHSLPRAARLGKSRPVLPM